MAAWVHTNYWNANFYESYRKYVRLKAESYKGRKEDCADLSVMIVIDFASANGLPLTFTDNAGIRYISKGTRQTPGGAGCNAVGKSWGNNDKSSYVDAVKGRIGAEALTLQNTDVNPQGPQPGDLFLKVNHAALIFGVYAPQTIHPLWNQFEENKPLKQDSMIPLFPGDDIAGKQAHQLQYYRDPINNADPKFIGPPAPKVHVDYLNHRGSVKPPAELIYWADPTVDALKDLEFRNYSTKVLDNWTDWNGVGDPPR